MRIRLVFMTESVSLVMKLCWSTTVSANLDIRAITVKVGKGPRKEVADRE